MQDTVRRAVIQALLTWWDTDRVPTAGFPTAAGLAADLGAPPAAVAAVLRQLALHGAITVPDDAAAGEDGAVWVTQIKDTRLHRLLH